MTNRFLYCVNRYVTLLILAFVAFSCSEDNEPSGPPVVNEQNQHVNRWIQENMEYWYLWNQELPSNVDKNLEPSDYFAALLSDDDRFSWIQEDYQELLNSLSGINKEAGYEYVLYKESENSENVVLQILYVKPNSPAQTGGLKRGDLVSKVNGQTLTSFNYRNVLRGLKENHTLTYKPVDYEAQSFGTETTVALSTVQYAENPNYLRKVIPVEGKKIGYYVYNFFATGDQSAFDEEMDNIFSQFKRDGITDLVLDVRFNSGGSEVSAKNLASLIGSGVTSSSVFFRRQYNTEINKEIIADPKYGEAFLTNLFADEAYNIGSLLSSKRVYVLTSSRTASASELIINSLKPYMEVFLIGDVTYGKNVGSISIYDENDARNTWGLQPIVLRVENSLGFSDYSSGFVPDIENKDNGLYVYPLGDPRENLLAEAIAHITGKTSSGGRVGAQSQKREILGHSLDDKKRSFRLVMENNLDLISK